MNDGVFVEITNKWSESVQVRIDKLNAGDQFALEDLMSDVWGEMVADLKTTPQEVGRAFSRSVKLGQIVRVREAGIRKSPRATLWERCP